MADTNPALRLATELRAAGSAGAAVTDFEALISRLAEAGVRY